MNRSSLICILALLNFGVHGSESGAWDLAVQALSHNIVSVHRGLEYPREIVLAGGNQFRTTWSWDFAFASNGLIKIGRQDAVKETLTSYLELQREDGLLPRTLDSMPIEWRVILGLSHINRQFKGPLRAWYVSENHVISAIPNLTLTWAAANYVIESGDISFAKKWYDVAILAVQFVESTFDHDDLLGHQQPFSDWEDSVARTGRVAFTNLMHLRALRGLIKWARLIGDYKNAGIFELKLSKQTKRFLDFFWDEEFGIVRNFENNRHLSADAQLFAIVDGVLNPSQAKRAFAALTNAGLTYPIPGKPTWPVYPKSMKSFFVKIGGMQDYHDSLTWGWLAALAAMAQSKMGNCMAYHDIMDKLSKLYVTHNEIGEVYELNGKNQLMPVKRWRYRSEAPFTWAAGMYISARTSNCR